MKKLLLAATLSLLASPALSQDRVSVLLDWFVNPDHGPLIIAQEKGYFAEENLEVEITAPSDPSLPPKLVAAGEADIAISYQPQLHLQVAEGLPLVRIGTLVATPLNCLLVKAEGPIKSIADLKGGKVGYSVAGVEEALMTAMLKPHGLTPDDIELINVNWSLSPAVMSGQVDAVIGAFRNFELTQMRIEGVEGRCFYPEEEGVPVYDELIYVTNTKLVDPLNTRRDVLVRFLRATEKATQYMINHPQETWEMFRATSAELQDELNERAWFDTLPRFSLRPMALDHRRYAAFSEFLAENKLIDAPQTAADVAIDLGAE
ncbi:MAG: ABC transporter substrate-binding protein [Pseudomonadota bacterium]